MDLRSIVVRVRISIVDNMKSLTLFVSLVSLCAAAHLDGTYLPPHGAASAGGSGHFLAPPGGFRPGSGYYQGNYRPTGPFIPILSYENRNFGDGTYRYSYTTGNGIAAHEQGTGGVGAQGAFSYTGDDGHQYSITYTADENGFHPQGAHLPTPPPIPPEIVESLRQNAAEEASGVYNDGSYRGEGASYGASAGAFHRVGHSGYNY